MHGHVEAPEVVDRRRRRAPAPGPRPSRHRARRAPAPRSRPPLLGRLGQPPAWASETTTERPSSRHAAGPSPSRSRPGGDGDDRPPCRPSGRGPWAGLAVAVDRRLPAGSQLPFGSGGRPSTRSPMMLRWIWLEPAVDRLRTGRRGRDARTRRARRPRVLPADDSAGGPITSSRAGPGAGARLPQSQLGDRSLGAPTGHRCREAAQRIVRMIVASACACARRWRSGSAGSPVLPWQLADDASNRARSQLVPEQGRPVRRPGSPAPPSVPRPSGADDVVTCAGPVEEQLVRTRSSWSAHDGAHLDARLIHGHQRGRRAPCGAATRVGAADDEHQSDWWPATSTPSGR